MGREAETTTVGLLFIRYLSRGPDPARPTEVWGEPGMVRRDRSCPDDPTIYHFRGL